MPYIKLHRREDLRPDRDGWSDGPATAGELNYLLTQQCLEFLEPRGRPSYADFNAVIGALECCKLEMYRRAVAPYEDQKIEENGDVY